ncbi:MAG: DUF3791 domain-containing protein [Paludibacteraceae bacterium]|nr:DUF3791 domain-containing protein [Paludibacteraceae bacterium]
MDKKLLSLWITALESYKRQFHLFGYEALTEFRRYGVFDLLTAKREQCDDLSSEKIGLFVRGYIEKKKDEGTRHKASSADKEGSKRNVSK